MPANFKTYEAQSRLIASIIAAHPDLRLNYKAIAKHYGSEWTESGIEHHFRPLKKGAIALRDLVSQGQDTKDLDIHSLKKAVDAGQSPASALGRAQSAAASVATPKSTRKRNATATPKTASSSKKAKKNVPRKDSDEDGDEDVDYEALDSTPSKESKGPRTWIDQTVLRAVTGHQQPIMSGALPALDVTHEPTPSEEDFVATPTQAYAPVHSFASATQPSQSHYGSFDTSSTMDTAHWTMMADNHKNFVDQQYAVDDDDGEI